MSTKFIPLLGNSHYTGKKSETNTETKVSVSKSVKKLKTSAKSPSNKIFKTPAVKASATKSETLVANPWESLIRYATKQTTKQTNKPSKSSALKITNKSTQMLSSKAHAEKACAAATDSTKSSFELQSSTKEVTAALRLIDKEALGNIITAINPKSTKRELNENGIRITTSPDIAGQVHNTYAVIAIPMTNRAGSEQRVWLVEKIRRSRFDDHKESLAREIVVYHTVRTLKAIHRAINNLSRKKAIGEDLKLITSRLYNRERLKALHRERTQKIKRNAEINTHLNALSMYLDKVTMRHIRNEIVCSTL